jgi:glycosyltransferase involved in cell wall biosynthesis
VTKIAPAGSLYQSSDASMRIAILMPAYNEALALAVTLGKIRDQASSVGAITVLLVDDGGEPAIAPQDLPTPTAHYRFVLARHAVNLGQGAALETARQLALREPDVDAYVTMDADGQHRVADAFALAQAVHDGADVAFGNRFTVGNQVPATRRLLLRAARRFEQALTGLRLQDAHNGLRGFSRSALERLPLHQNRMAHATEIKQRVSRAGPLRIVEVPVSLRYTAETLAKGQGALGAIDIVRDLLQEYLFGEHP